MLAELQIRLVIKLRKTVKIKQIHKLKASCVNNLIPFRVGGVFTISIN